MPAVLEVIRLFRLHCIKSLFAWPQLKQSVEKFVQACEMCHKAKVEHVRLLGQLQPLPIPQQAWSTFSLDFIEGLLKSSGYDVIFVFIDKFSKWALPPIGSSL